MDYYEELARGLHEWPGSAVVAKSRLSELNGFYWRGETITVGARVVISRSQWQAKRDELSGKPKVWDGNYLCQRSDGYWYSFNEEPYIDSLEIWVTKRGHLKRYGFGSVLGDWRDTLEERVVKSITDDFEVTPNGNMTYHGDKPVNANMIFNPGDSLVRAGVEDRAEWDGEGLPPVGCRVMIHNDSGYVLRYGHDVIGCNGEVKANIKSGETNVVVVEVDGSCFCFRLDMIKRIKTPKEKAIEEMLALDPDDGLPKMLSRSEFCGILYDAKYRIQGSDDEQGFN